MSQKATSSTFVAASWIALAIGVTGYLIGLYRAEMLLSEKGYFLTLLLYGLFSAVAVQKSVRDKEEGIPVSSIFYGISWASVLIVVILFTIGLVNAEIWPSEKGFYVFGFILALFGAISTQKATRDADADKKANRISSNHDND